MELKIVHQTHYDYPEKVFLNPHYLNFYPQSRPSFSLKEFELKIEPTPSGLFPKMDLENNYQHQCWFNELTDHLTLEATIVVDTLESNPFGFFYDRSQEGQGSVPDSQTLNDRSIEMQWFVREIYDSCGGQVINFLTSLLDKVAAKWGHEVRYEENILDPEDCFDKKNGSCRDLTWMLMHMLGHYHLPTRFVSGYAYNPELGEGHELHAWLEVHLPGAGWIGLDPSAGLFTTASYIPVSTSYYPKNTMPVVGSYRGEKSARLETSVSIRKIG